MLPWVMAILMLAARSARRVAAPGAARHASARLGIGDVIGPRAARPLLRRARWVPDSPGSHSRFAFGGGGSSRGGAHGGGEAAPSGGSQGAWASNGRDGGRFNLLEAVRHAVVLSDVISESGVEVERRGQAMYARCPFHGDGNERSPSLSINDALGKFRCFGCDERGDVLNYVMLKEGLSFREALAALATRYQIQRHSGQAASPRSSERRAAPPRPVSLTPEARARQLAVMEAATNHYEAALRERSAQACADMLRRRGVRSPTAALFRLGFAPASPSDHLTRCLLSGGFTAEEIVDAGLALRRSSDGSMFDRFGGRLVIPILNAGGHVVGFGARRVDGGSGEPREEGVEGEGAGKREAPKYINTKESSVFRKGEILYALPMASAAARKRDCIIVVEGCARGGSGRAAAGVTRLPRASHAPPLPHPPRYIDATSPPSSQVHGRHFIARRWLYKHGCVLGHGPQRRSDRGGGITIAIAQGETCGRVPALVHRKGALVHRKGHLFTGRGAADNTEGGLRLPRSLPPPSRPPHTPLGGCPAFG